MLRVLQVVGVMNRGGAEVMLMEILRNKPKDVQFDFLVNNPPSDLFKKGTFDDEIRSYGCQIKYIGTQLRIGPLHYIKEFKKIVSELNPNIVHIHLNGKSGIIALAARLSGRRKIITHCHANIKFRGHFLSKIFSELELFFQKFLISLFATDWWGCSSDANARLYWPWIRRKSVVINNAIDISLYEKVDKQKVDQLRRSYNLSEGTIVLGNVGRIVPQKNIKFVVDVIATLASKGHKVAFIIAGRKEDSEYVNSTILHAREVGVEKSLIFLGERSDIPLLMYSFDVFVGPALKEGFGMVAVEAQSAGTPSVLFKGFPKSVDMGLGLCSFIEDFNVETWADRIITSFQRGRLENFDIIKRNIIENGFDAISNTKRIIELYRA